MKRKNGFTLIELIAVLVIMAILALIVTPLVMNIIRKAKISAAKRSIDAYGRSIELAIAGYLMDTGAFPTSIGELTIEYSGPEVVCSTTQLNSDSSVYLTGCTVGGKSVDYAYGKYEEPTYTAYSVGDQVSYNNVDYYVIANSGTSESTVTLLKSEPLTVAEVNQYGSGHVNMYTSPTTQENQQAVNANNSGYGGMAYYSSERCGYVNSYVYNDGCTNNYMDSEIKYVVDAWKTSKAPAATEARLIQYDEFENLGYEWINVNTSGGVDMKLQKIDDTIAWVYNENYSYWTMSPYNDSSSSVWYVNGDGNLSENSVGNNYVVRPVIVLSKSVL